jgi:hypothetical protein
MLVGEALKPVRDKIVLATKSRVDKTEHTSTREGLLEESPSVPCRRIPQTARDRPYRPILSASGE